MEGITFLMIAAQNDMLHCILFYLDSLPKFGIHCKITRKWLARPTTQFVLMIMTGAFSMFTTMLFPQLRL
jgi:hypothetical protein